MNQFFISKVYDIFYSLSIFLKFLLKLKSNFQMGDMKITF